MQIVIEKQRRTLTLIDDGQPIWRCPIALGSQPVGAKRMQGDGRTPEGDYFICLTKENGKYGRSLGLSYPNPLDAQLAFDEGRIDERTLTNIRTACTEGRRPPWGSPLGGEIYIHEGGSATDWTAGCIALDSGDMDQLFPHWPQVDSVKIHP